MVGIAIFSDVCLYTRVVTKLLLVCDIWRAVRCWIY